MNHKTLPHPFKRWIDSVNQIDMTLIHAFKRSINSVNQTDMTQPGTIAQMTGNAIDTKQCILPALFAFSQKRMA